MADYAKTTLVTQYSENSDFTSPSINEVFTKTQTTPVKKLMTTVSAATGGTTIELGNFTTILSLVVINHDTTNYVTFTHDSAGNIAVDNKGRISIGEFYRTCDVTVATDLVLTADTAACECTVIVYGT